MYVLDCARLPPSPRWSPGPSGGEGASPWGGGLAAGDRPSRPRSEEPEAAWCAVGLAKVEQQHARRRAAAAPAHVHGARARLGRRGASAGSLVRLDDGQACTAEGRRAHSPRHHQRKPPPRAGCSLSKHGLWGALSHPSGPEQQQQQPTGGAAEAGRSGETSSVSDEQQKYGGHKLPYCDPMTNSAPCGWSGCSISRVSTVSVAQQPETWSQSGSKTRPPICLLTPQPPTRIGKGREKSSRPPKACWLTAGAAAAGETGGGG